jgi:hypothetical protein
MIRELVVDASVIAGLTMNAKAREAYPILNRRSAQTSPTGCPKCPNKRARHFTDVKAIKEQMAAMTPDQALRLKEILGAQTLVFHMTGPMGLREIRI